MPREIPTIADYSHWNEEAAQVWWAENRYDMERTDEPDPYDDEDRWPSDEGDNE